MGGGRGYIGEWKGGTCEWKEGNTGTYVSG